MTHETTCETSPSHKSHQTVQMEIPSSEILDSLSRLKRFPTLILLEQQALIMFEVYAHQDCGGAILLLGLHFSNLSLPFTSVFIFTLPNHRPRIIALSLPSLHSIS